MGNTNQNASIVIVSNDTRLRNILTNNPSEKRDQRFVSIESDIAKLSPKLSDAYVYDLDVASGSTEQATQHISDLKAVIDDKPLLLIGKQQTINEVTSNPAIESMIVRSITKPLSYGQLQLAIQSSTLNPNAQQLVSAKKSFRPRQLTIIGLVSAVALLAAITLMTKESSLQLNTEQTHSLTNDSVKPPQQPINSNATESQELRTLNQLALSALVEGRLTQPENNSAWHFLKQIELIDAYNTSAHQTRKRLFSLLESSYQQAQASGNSTEIEKTLSAIVEVEPYNHHYSKLLGQLQLSINTQQNAESTKKSIEPSLVTVKTRDTRPLNESPALAVSTNPPKNIAPEAKPKPAKLIPGKNSQKSTQIDRSGINSLNKKKKLASLNDQQTHITPEVVIDPPKVLKRIEPDYPRHAVSLNHEGWVELEYQVDAQGNAINIQVTEGKRIKTFERAAIRAIEQWEFSPSKNVHTSETVLSEPMTAKFEFTLDG